MSAVDAPNVGRLTHRAGGMASDTAVLVVAAVRPDVRWLVHPLRDS
jgi:hypothetical protein